MDNDKTYTIAQVSELLQISTKTIRRRIKRGELKASMIPGKYGLEYRITELPDSLGQKYKKTIDNSTDLIRELSQKNLELAGNLGRALERINNLENQIKLLSMPRKTWWGKLLRRG